MGKRRNLKLRTFKGGRARKKGGVIVSARPTGAELRKADIKLKAIRQARDAGVMTKRDAERKTKIITKSLS